MRASPMASIFAFPAAFFEAGHAAQVDVGPEAAAVEAEAVDGAVGGHQEGQNVEAFARLDRHDHRPWSDRRFDFGTDAR